MFEQFGMFANPKCKNPIVCTSCKIIWSLEDLSLPEAVLKDKIDAAALGSRDGGTSAKGKGTCKEKLATAKAEDSCAAKGGGGVVAPLTFLKGKDKEGKGGNGPKRPKG